MVGKFKRNMRTWGVDIAAFVVIFIIVQLVATLILICGVDGLFDSEWSITDYGFMMTYACAMLPILMLTTRYESWRYRYSMPIKASAQGIDPVFILWGVMLLFATNIAITPLTDLLPPANQDMPIGGYTLFTVCVLAPVLEEYIFRGRLFSLFYHSTSALTSATLSAMLFGVIHVSPQVIIGGFIAGLIFSYAYMIKGSIIAPIILHMCNNGVAYAMIVLSYQDKSIPELLGENVNWPIVYTISLIIFLLGMAHVIRTIRRKGRVGERVECAVESSDAVAETAPDTTK